MPLVHLDFAVVVVGSEIAFDQGSGARLGAKTIWSHRSLILCCVNLQVRLDGWEREIHLSEDD